MDIRNRLSIIHVNSKGPNDFLLIFLIGFACIWQTNKNFALCSVPPPSSTGSPLPHHPICHDGNLSVCESAENAAPAPHCTSFPHITCTVPLSTTTSSGPHLHPLHFSIHSGFLTCILCRDFKDISHQNCTSTSKILEKNCRGIPNNCWKYLGRFWISVQECFKT